MSLRVFSILNGERALNEAQVRQRRLEEGLRAGDAIFRKSWFQDAPDFRSLTMGELMVTRSSWFVQAFGPPIAIERESIRPERKSWLGKLGLGGYSTAAGRTTKFELLVGTSRNWSVYARLVPDDDQIRYPNQSGDGPASAELPEEVQACLPEADLQIVNDIRDMNRRMGTRLP